MEWEPDNPYEALEYTSDGKLINVAFRHGVKETAKKLVKLLDENEMLIHITDFEENCWEECMACKLRRQVGLE